MVKVNKVHFTCTQKSELAVGIPRGRRVPAQQIRLLERPPQATRHRGVHERLILFRLGLVRTARDDARHLRTGGVVCQTRLSTSMREG